MFIKSLLTVFAILLLTQTYSQPSDSLIRSLQAEVAGLKKRVDSMSAVKPSPTPAKTDSPATASSASDSCNGIAFFSLEGLLITAPILLFLGLFVYIVRRLRREQFHLSEALSTFRPSKTTTVNKTFLTDGTSTRQENQHAEDKLVRSTSRTLAFLTGIVALIIAVAVTSYSGYHALSGFGKTVAVDDLWKLLAALGIGVIPYGVNVLGGNKKEEPSTPPAT